MSCSGCTQKRDASAAAVAGTAAHRCCYFCGDERINALQKSVDGWMGTPFHEHAQIRGAGVDCVHLALAIYGECGLFPEAMVLPAYDITDGTHSLDAGLFDRWIEATRCFARVARPGLDPRTLRPGDLMVMKIGAIPFHLGIVYAPGGFVQALRRHKVQAYTLGYDSTFWNRVLSVWRPIERGAA